jgi:ATP-dependent helicase/nuclease subunit A
VASERDYASWKEARETLVSKASRPSIRVMTVTASAHSPTNGSGAAGEIVVERLARAMETRPGGRRFGALVHRLLAAVDLNGGPQAVSTTVAIQARLVGATEEEVEAAVSVATRALSHPLLKRAAVAAAAGNLRRETPVIVRKSDGSLVEGVVDLAFRGAPTEFDSWTVVDFKTDREFEASSGPYLVQVGLYVDAIAEATGMRTHDVLLVV